MLKSEVISIGFFLNKPEARSKPDKYFLSVKARVVLERAVS